MNGEFIVHLKTYDTARITQAFGEHFGHKLSQAYSRSSYNRSGIVKETDFCAGYRTNDSLFLVHNREGSALKIYVEPTNQHDLHNMKVILNKYFGELVKMLEKEKIKWADPQAAILLENCPLYGMIKSKKQRMIDMLGSQRGKLFFTPVSSIVVFTITMYYALLPREDAIKDLIKAFLSTLGAYIAQCGLIIGKILVSDNKKKFSFNF